MGMPKNGTLVERVFDSIYALLISGELTAGQLISQRELAEKCHSSLGTTAAAMRLLEQDGIIISHPRRGGSQVAVITLDDLWGTLQLRLAIEQRALLLTCKYGTEEDFARLAELGELADSTSISQQTETSAAEYAFHSQLLACSHTDAITRQARVIRTYLLKLHICPALPPLPRTQAMYLANGEQQATCGHIELAEMIAKRDLMKAQEFLELHTTSSLAHPLLATNLARSRAMVDNILHHVPLPETFPTENGKNFPKPQ